MDPTTLVTFLFRAPPETATVELVGSWDNFSQPYRMHHDCRRGRGLWTGCFRFQNIIFDGGNQASWTHPREGGLKQGGTYWYFYRLDDEIEAYDSREALASTCPLLPGQTVNVLEVPIEIVDPPTRCQSASVDVAGTLVGSHTMDPAGRFAAPVPPPLSKLHHKCVSDHALNGRLKRDAKAAGGSTSASPGERSSKLRLKKSILFDIIPKRLRPSNRAKLASQDHVAGSRRSCQAERDRASSHADLDRIDSPVLKDVSSLPSLSSHRLVSPVSSAREIGGNDSFLLEHEADVVTTALSSYHSQSSVEDMQNMSTEQQLYHSDDPQLMSSPEDAKWRRSLNSGPDSSLDQPYDPLTPTPASAFPSPGHISIHDIPSSCSVSPRNYTQRSTNSPPPGLLRDSITNFDQGTNKNIISSPTFSSFTLSSNGGGFTAPLRLSLRDTVQTFVDRDEDASSRPFDEEMEVMQDEGVFNTKDAVHYCNGWGHADQWTGNGSMDAMERVSERLRAFSLEPASDWRGRELTPPAHSPGLDAPDVAVAALMSAEGVHGPAQPEICSPGEDEVPIPESESEDKQARFGLRTSEVLGKNHDFFTSLPVTTTTAGHITSDTRTSYADPTHSRPHHQSIMHLATKATLAELAYLGSAIG